jgi:hypothetical protein
MAPPRITYIKSAAQIQATPPSVHGNFQHWTLLDSESGAVFSWVHVDVTDPDNPGPPEQTLTPKEAMLPSGSTVELRASFSFTDESLKQNQAVWELTFGRPLQDFGGRIAWKNLAIFQAEYGRIRNQNPGMPPQEIGDLAIREVPFGKWRIERGFDDLSVIMESFGDVVLKAGPNAGQRLSRVPVSVKVVARRTAP